MKKTTSLPSERIDLAATAKGRTLLTRDQGQKLREEILARVANCDRITLDLSSATALSPSFADELFGGLDSALGAEFRNRIQIVCPQPEWRTLISSALGHRRAKAAS